VTPIVRRCLAAAGLWLACLAPATAATQTHDYSVVIQQQIAGHVTVTVEDDGRVAVDQSYRNNGRGPDIRERYRLDAQGAPVAYEVQGRSTFGAEIREDFALDAGRLRWTSRIDRGDEPAAPGTLFLPLESSFAYGGELVRALLRRPDGRAPVVGGHQLAVERVATLALDNGALPLVLVAMTGADATPWYLWHRDDASQRLFAIAWPGFAVVAKGHEGAVETLVARMQQARDERLRALRQRLGRGLPGLTLIRGVRWFDAPAARMRGPSDIYLRAGRIATITQPGRLRADADHVIDGAGRTLIPGLFDMHAHLWPEMGPLNIAAGVTSAREMAGENAEVQRLQSRLAADELIGPTLYAAGFIEGRSPFSARYGFVVDSLEEGLRAVDWYAARGYRRIKLYNSIKPQWVKPLAARAHALGLKVAGHVPAFMLAEQAVRDGYDELTHINQVMLNFVTRPGDDPRTLMRFTRVGDDGQRLDVNGASARRFISLVRRRGVVFDATLNAFENIYTQAQGQPQPGLAPVAEHLPAAWRRNLRVAEMDLEGAKLAAYCASWQRMLALTRAMHRAGVPLVAGTDIVPGLGLQRELELLVQAGIPAAEALRVGTWNGARVAGADAVAGSIAPGKAADLVLIEGDPTRRIADIRRASLVLRGGVAYLPAQLYEAMGFKPIVPGASIQAPPAR
jgi:hypothetical protein